MQDAILLNREKLEMRLAERGIAFSKSLDDACAIGTISLAELDELRVSRDDLADTLGACGMFGVIDRDKDLVRVSER